MLLCDVSYVTINEKFSWKLLHCNDNASKSSAYQGCEVATQIAGSGSGHLNFFGSSRTILFKQSEKIYWIICITRLSHKLPLWMRNPNFKLQLHHQKCLDSACSHPKLFRDPVSQLCWAHSHEPELLDYLSFVSNYSPKGTVHWIGLQIQCSIQIYCFRKHSVRYESCF